MDDSFTTVEPRPYEARFKPTLVKRAKRRLESITILSDQAWEVSGDPKLGDQYPEYLVTLPPGDRTYTCSCHSHFHGGTRQKKMCSHVLAVILWRREQRVTPGVTARARTDGGQLPTSQDSPPASPGRVSFPPVAQDTGEDHGVGRKAHSEPVPVVDNRIGPNFGRPLRSGEGVAVSSSSLPSPVVGHSSPGPSPHFDPVADDPRHPSWVAGDADRMPEWVESFRDHQPEATERITDAYASGARVVFLDAPTGTGKTLIGDMVRRLVAPRNGLYVCTTIGLQEQVIRDFPNAALLKGRSNYPTYDNPAAFPEITSADCIKEQVVGEPGEPVMDCGRCRGTEVFGESGSAWHCDECHPWYLNPYEMARDAAAHARLAVLNTAYFLTEANGPGRFSGRELVVVDEADRLEEELMGQIEVTFSSRTLRELGLSVPEKVTVPSSWQAWIVGEAVPALREKWAQLNMRFKRAPRGSAERRKLNRRLKFYEDLGQKVRLLHDQLAEGWVLTGYSETPPRVTFRPIKVDQQAPEYLWRHGERWLLMSATIISPDQMAMDLGLERNQWRSVNVSSLFDRRRRPVIYRPAANMAQRNQTQAWPEMAAAVRRVLREHPDERVLVHTVSYKLAEYLANRLDDPRVVTYRSAAERQVVLERFKQVPGTVAIVPSWDRGVDLPDELCRVIVVAKVPYPYLGDKQVSARLHSRGGQGWYAMQTVRTLVQMTGRGMRHEDDWCITYILDEQFQTNVWKKSKAFLPSWWRDALEWGGNVTEEMQVNGKGGVRERLAE